MIKEHSWEEIAESGVWKCKECGVAPCYSDRGCFGRGDGMTEQQRVGGHLSYSDNCVKLASKREGDPRYLALLDQLKELHCKKSADYGTNEDSLANVRASQEFGVSPFVGTMIRLNDKITRIKSFIKKGKLQNESVYDSLKDIAVYALIAHILLEEEQGNNAKKEPIFPQETNEEDKDPIRSSE